MQPIHCGGGTPWGVFVPHQPTGGTPGRAAANALAVSQYAQSDPDRSRPDLSTALPAPAGWPRRSPARRRRPRQRAQGHAAHDLRRGVWRAVYRAAGDAVHGALSATAGGYRAEQSSVGFGTRRPRPGDTPGAPARLTHGRQPPGTTTHVLVRVAVLPGSVWAAT